jgi:hypothetical protein
MAKVVHSQTWTEASKVSKVEVWEGLVPVGHRKISKDQNAVDQIKM